MTPALLTIFSTPILRGFDSEFAYKVLILLKFRSPKMRKPSHPKILESATRNQPDKPVLQHSVNYPAGGDSAFSSAWPTDVSQINPERGKISNFCEN